jgi:hypothetical protein
LSRFIKHEVQHAESEKKLFVETSLCVRLMMAFFNLRASQYVCDVLLSLVQKVRKFVFWDNQPTQECVVAGVA